MRSITALLVVMGLTLAACGDSGDFSSCDDLAQGGLDLLQEILDEVDQMSLADFAEAAEQEEPEFLMKFEDEADRLDAAQVDLGCTDDELSDYLVANLDQLSAEGAVGQLMIEAIKSDPSGFLDN